MTPPPAPITADLASWTDIAGKEDWSALLIGNGASMAVWQGFGYGSLYDRARSDKVDNPLAEEDVAIFEWAKTTNFELVLQSLSTAHAVNTALHIEHKPITERYEHIKRALIQAVRTAHVPWSKVPTSTLRAIRDALLKYDYVYSTNYDLLAYWSVMVEPKAAGFIDYFWGPDLEFSLTNTQVRRKATKILFLHGALHIYRLPGGRTVKRSATGGNLLRSFGSPHMGSPIPLFISEGTASDKLRSIRGSDYLGFGLTELARNDGSLVVFGSSLGESDQHIVNAISDSARRSIAIGLRPGNPHAIQARKAELQLKFQRAELYFFDSSTHPLGGAGLSVPP